MSNQLSSVCKSERVLNDERWVSGEPIYLMILMDFLHQSLHDTSVYRSEIGLLGSKLTRPLWAWPWPCGRDLCWLGKSSLCSLWPCPQGHAHKARATPTKASSSLEPRRPILDRSMKNPLVSIDKWTCHCPMEGAWLNKVGGAM